MQYFIFGSRNLDVLRLLGGIKDLFKRIPTCHRIVDTVSKMHDILRLVIHLKFATIMSKSGTIQWTTCALEKFLIWE